MKENFWNSYPVLGAMVLGASGAALMFNGFYLLDGIPDTPQKVFKLKVRICAALVLWVAGSGIVSRTRNSSWAYGLFCGLLFIPGFVLLLLTTGRKTRQEIWQAANPELVGRAARRQYRDLRPLY